MIAVKTNDIQEFIKCLKYIDEEIILKYDGGDVDDSLIEWFNSGCKSYVTCLESKGRIFAERIEKDYKVRYVSEPGNTFAMTRETAEILKGFKENDNTSLGQFLIRNGISCIQILSSQL